MKKSSLWVLLAGLLLSLQLAGCGGPPPQVDNTSNTKLTPARQAIINQRKKQDGDL